MMALDQTPRAGRGRRSNGASVDFEQLAQNATVRIIVADRDLKIIYMNPSSIAMLRKLEHLLPCPVDQILGQSIDIFHKNPQAQRQFLSNPENLPHNAVIRLGP